MAETRTLAELSRSGEEPAIPGAAARRRWPFRSRGTRVGLLVVLSLFLAAIFAPLIAPYSPYATSATDALSPPNRVHILGADSLGRDIFSRALHGARVSLLVGILAVTLSLILGSIVGITAGYFGKWVDAVLMQINDMFIAIPGIVLALAIVAAMGSSITGVVLAIAISSAPGDARLARSKTLYERTLDYVTAARAIGCRQPRILTRYILPNISSVLIVRATASLGAAILTEAGLSFLGLGVPPPTPTWGGMISDGRQYIFTAPYVSIIPGLFIIATVLAFNVVGDGLRDILDPRSRQR